MYYSQQGEDYFINRYLINKRCEDGVYLEVGGYDGVTYSNTLFFNRSLDFRGILIEPIPEMYERMVVNRTTDTCLNLAIGTGEPMKFVGRGATAGLRESMADSFLRSHHKVVDEYLVPTRTLSDILKDANITYIDLMSIDVEGGEEIVLETMNWDVEVYVICIELDGHNQSKDERCRDILRSRGFLPIRRMCINEFWINPNYSRKDRLFDPSQMRPFRGIMKEPQKYTERGCISDINRSIVHFDGLYRANRVSFK